MFRFAPPISLRLLRGEMLSWHRGPVRLRVLSGLVWVTQPNDLHDHFLPAGQSMELNHGFIGAERDAQVSFEIRHSALVSAWLNLLPRGLEPVARPARGESATPLR